MSREGLLEALASYPTRVAAAAATTGSTPPGEWSPTEVVRHLIAVEREVHQARLLDLATLDDPRWNWAEPGPWPGEPELTLDQLLDRFAADRAWTVANVRALDETGLARAGMHATFGRLDVTGLVRLAIDHDAEHLAGLLDPGGR